MNIPTILSINTDISNKNVQYNLVPESYIYNNDILLYKFPHINDTYWTHFKYHHEKNIDIEIEIVLFTFDGYEYTVSSNEKRIVQQWYDTIWPIPSISTTEKHSGIYFKIKSPSPISITLSGYRDLFPNVKNYLLLTKNNNTYQFVFSKNDNGGIIYVVENNDYIREIIPTSCVVRQIKNY